MKDSYSIHTARPAATPEAQAHRKLKPPRWPGTSTTSPIKKRPGTLLAKLFWFTNKIQNFRVVALCHKDIRGFDVPMNDAFRMRGIESVRNFDGHVEALVDFRRVIADQLLQRCPFQKLHGQECFPVCFANAVDRADVRVIQRRSGLRFSLEAGQSLSTKRRRRVSSAL